MKRFLVPTDFSPLADHTLDYAAQLAGYAFAELILFHAYYQPVFANDAMIAQPIYAQLETECQHKLQALKDKMALAYPDLKVSWDYRMGLPADAINTFAGEHRIDLIVIGAQGAGYLAERIFGSISTALVRKAVCPVLIIDREVQFRKPEKIVLAADYQHIVSDTVLKPLKELLTHFDAHLYILHISPEGDKVEHLHESIAQFELDRSFKHYDHAVIFSHNQDVIDGINDFVDLHEAGMVVLIPEKHSFFERLFHEPHINRMTVHSKAPLLALHNTH